MLKPNDVSIIASFIAGILTFISPCILPLIPGYISFITGISLDELKTGRKSVKVAFFNALFFVLGFSVVFVLLGMSASYLGGLIAEKRPLIRWIGGVIIIIFGLQVSGILRFRFLYQEKRPQIKKKFLGYLGSFLIGFVFATGWTPCIGPILSSVLILASTQETIYKGALLLIVYSIGLGLPLLITALFVNSTLNLFTKIKKFYSVIELVSGIILIIIGILLITNNLNR